MPKIRVMLVDDHILFRKGLASLMSARPEIEVVAEASDGKEAVELSSQLEPDLILMDIHMPVCNGIEATRAIRTAQPDMKIVMLTVSDDEEDLYGAIKAGAGGYLLKNLRPESLFEMIQDAVRGEAPISPGIAAKILEELGRSRERERDDASDESQLLTQREREILILVVDGASNKEIAQRLHITEGTVKNHLHHILEKLHLENRVQVTAYALRKGLVSPRQSPEPQSGNGQA
jgi:two-component system, NarL family, nitrate/nitrite response regulator NarL